MTILGYFWVGFYLFLNTYSLHLDMNDNFFHFPSPLAPSHPSVLAGQVVSTKLFSRNRRVTLKVLSLDYRAKHVPKVRKELSVTITCKAHRCDCPNLKDGKLYLLSATYQKTWNRFILNTNTFWRDWHWYLSFQVKTFSRKCQNVSKQQF